MVEPTAGRGAGSPVGPGAGERTTSRATMVAAVFVIAGLRFRVANLDTPEAQWVMLVLAVLWLTWLFTSLLEYWGAGRTAARVLLVFGSFWGLFTVAGHLTEPLALLMEVVPFVAPFFILAWTAGRWPRLTGVLLLALSAAGFVVLFDLGREFTEGPSRILTFVILLVPLAACGLALVREGGTGPDQTDQYG